MAPFHWAPVVASHQVEDMALDALKLGPCVEGLPLPGTADGQEDEAAIAASSDILWEDPRAAAILPNLQRMVRLQAEVDSSKQVYR